MIERWDDLRLFLAVAREGSLAAAAQSLQVHTTTVFRRLKALEDALGTCLFERQSMSLSVAGERLYEAAVVVEEAIQEAQLALLGQQQLIQGVVRLTTTASVMPLISTPLVEFSRQCPAVEVVLLLDDREYRLEAMEADLALRPGRRPTQDQLLAQRVSGLAFALYASGEYLARRGALKEGSLEGHEVILGHESLAQLASERWFKAQLGAASHRVALRSNSVLGHLEAAKQGIGVVCLPCFIAQRAMSGLVRLSEPVDEPDYGLWLVQHAQLKQTARVRALREHLAQSLGQQRDLLEGRR